MGVNLYTDPSLCIRELLQNALDAVQLRENRLQYETAAPTGTDAYKPEVTLRFGVENGEEYISVEDNVHCGTWRSLDGNLFARG